MTAELEFPENCKYTNEHIWVKPDGDNLVIGITDFAQAQLGEVVYVEVPEPGDEFGSDSVFGSIESFKAVSELFMPLTGEIAQVNNALEDEPTLVNTAPYSDGWIAVIKKFNAKWDGALLDADAYKTGLAL